MDSRIRGWICSTLGVLLAAVGCAAMDPGSTPPQFSLSPEPSWTTAWAPDLETVEPNRDSISDGVRYLLVDNQILLGATNACYNHYAFRFLTEAGMRESAAIQIRFDPSFETLRFHVLRLWRGTNQFDCLRTTTFRTVQREESLEWQMLDGRLTMVALPEDVRVGDVLEYAYTLSGNNPVFDGRAEGAFLLGWNASAEKRRLRFLIPPGRSLARCISGTGAADPEEREVDGYREWLWDLSHTAAVQAESDLPIWYKPFPQVAYSEYTSWADVGRWAAALYAISNRTAMAAALRTQLEAWRQLPGAEERTLAALQFVQDEIRYFGLEFGSGSHRPSPPELVLQRRFGDCKDKAVLLCALLSELNVESYPALVNVLTRQEVRRELPSPTAFNHVVVVALVNGAIVWIDPTRSHQQGRLRDRHMPPYGAALVVSGAASTLQPFVVSGMGDSLTWVHERFDIPNMRGSARLTVRTVYRGRDADTCRAQFANLPRGDLERRYLNYTAQLYPGIQTNGCIQVEDAAGSNVITVIESYRISNLWAPDRTLTNRLSFSVSAHTLQPYVRQPTTVLRSTPLGLPYPLDLLQTTEIHLPDDWKITPSNQVIQDNYLQFWFATTYTNRTLVHAYRIKTVADAVPVTDVPAHLARRRQIREMLGQTIYQPLPGAVAQAWPFTPNWPNIGLILLWCLLLASGWILLYRHRRPAAGVLYVPPPDAGAGPTGLGGWLVLVCIQLFSGLLVTLFGLARLRLCYDADRWHALTTPGTLSYHEFWLPTLLFESLAAYFMLAWISLLLVFFFQRRTLFPRLMIACYIVQIIYLATDGLLAWSLPAVSHAAAVKSFTAAGRSAVAACIWIPYLLLSKRVRNTFCR